MLCQEVGAIVYEKCSSELLQSVEANLERHIPGDSMSEGQKFTDEAVDVRFQHLSFTFTHFISLSLISFHFVLSMNVI